MSVAAVPRAGQALVVLLLLTGCGAGKGESDAAPAASVAGAQQPATDPRAAIFVAKGCPQCHSISALGVKSAAEAGPDLTLAYQDVQARFGLKLEEFLPHPTGTMQIVLSSMIQLTPAERDSIVHILKRLYEEREEREEREETSP